MIVFRKAKEFLEWMNKKGVPVPIARVDGKPSVSFTLLIMSAAFVMLGLLNPVVNLGINFWEALAWHATSAVLYYNRSAKISKDGVEISSSDDENKSE
jgi:hypothetical protein